MLPKNGVVGRWTQKFLKPTSRPKEIVADSLPPVEAICVDSKPVITGEDDRAKLVQRFVDQGRTAILLRAQIAETLECEHLNAVYDLFQKEMGYVEGGEVTLSDWTFEESEIPAGHLIRHSEEVSPCFLDRCAVTNGKFREFVADGGYAQQTLWDSAIWPRVPEFVDATGKAGPRFWRDGTFPAGEEQLPVVGVNWFEANAFARWTGRRLPTDGEWVKAAAFPGGTSEGKPVPRKFPWGDTLELHRVNLWVSGPGRTVPVHQHTTGSSDGAFHQLIGNVWEWTSSEVLISSYGRPIDFDVPLKSLRGGAFDTYFENQATCQLQSADSPMARRHNIGFRCALSAEDVIELGVLA